MTKHKKGNFVLKDGAQRKKDKYICVSCSKAGIKHKVINVPGPKTKKKSICGPGLPTTKRHCTGCGAEDGPWIQSTMLDPGM